MHNSYNNIQLLTPTNTSTNLLSTNTSTINTTSSSMFFNDSINISPPPQQQQFQHTVSPSSSSFLLPQSQFQTLTSQQQQLQQNQQMTISKRSSLRFFSNVKRDSVTFRKKSQNSDELGIEFLMDHNQLTKRYKTYIMNLCKQCLSNIETENNITLDKKWCITLYELGRLATNRVQICYEDGDQRNILNYAKILCIPSGKIDDSAYVDGLMFKKNIIHKVYIIIVIFLYFFHFSFHFFFSSFSFSSLFLNYYFIL